MAIGGAPMLQLEERKALQSRAGATIQGHRTVRSCDEVAPLTLPTLSTRPARSDGRPAPDVLKRHAERLQQATEGAGASSSGTSAVCQAAA
jgi:hypothetical protein